MDAGEAWQNGQVVLSWQDVLSDSRNPDDGRNLFIHEFAHCLDGLDGEMVAVRVPSGLRGRHRSECPSAKRAR